MSGKPWQAHPAVDDEVDAALAYYERQRVGLGLELLDELAATRRRLESSPYVGTIDRVRGYDVRRSRLERFPYALVFTELANEFLVLAFAHAKRRPYYWRARLPELVSAPRKRK
jgi:toxin ParE1/3/4